MRTWNVRRSVVEVVEADTAEIAEHLLTQALLAAGFEPFGDDDFETYETD